MGFKELFTGEDVQKLDYLEIERKKIWGRIGLIEEKLDKKTTDYEKEAQQSSKKASEFRNK